jgi:hypothetical protein
MTNHPAPVPPVDPVDPVEFFAPFGHALRPGRPWSDPVEWSTPFADEVPELIALPMTGGQE